MLLKSKDDKIQIQDLGISSNEISTNTFFYAAKSLILVYKKIKKPFAVNVACL